MAIFASRHSEGPRVICDRKTRRPKLTKAQVIANRNDQWLHAHTVGIYDPATGRLRRRPRWELAALYGVSVETIRVGLKAARAARAQVIAFADANDG